MYVNCGDVIDAVGLGLQRVIKPWGASAPAGRTHYDTVWDVMLG